MLGELKERKIEGRGLNIEGRLQEVVEFVGKL
jgi:hypothetical protein